MSRAGRVSCVVALLLGCLPAETREAPGRLALSVRTSPGFLESTGRVSDDGWTLRVDRYLVGLGSAELDGDDCEAYSEGGYGRILDMTRGESQALSVTFGLGRCQLAMRLNGPRWDSVLGAGVPAEIATLLAVPGSDTVRDDLPVSVYVEGMAARGAVLKRFAWAFRAEVSYEACRPATSEGAPQLVALRSGHRLSLELAFHADALFVDDDRLSFGPFARTDDSGDADGTITLSELASDSKLFQDIYYTRLPAQIALPSGTCATTVNPKEDDD